MQGTLTPAECEELKRLAKKDPDKTLFLTFLSTRKGDFEKDQLEAEINYEKTRPNDLHSMIFNEGHRRKAKIKPLYWFGAIFAACFICLFGLFWFIGRDQLSADKGEEWEQMATEKGERKFFRMRDGTEVWLNSESSLKVKKGYGKKHRLMELRGEAYFSVTKSEKLPLYVKALDTEIEVIGTVFNVRAYPDEPKVATSLIEGKVKLHVDRGSQRKDYELNPGDKVEVLNKFVVDNVIPKSLKKDLLEKEMVDRYVGYKKIAIANEEALEALWIDNKLVFNGDPLEDMARKMERWYNITIVIENESLKEERFSGVFQEQTAEQVLDILRTTGVELNYKSENGTIYIK